MRDLRDFATSGRPDDPVTFQTLDLGDVVFAGMSGEVVSSYAHWMRTVNKGKATLCVGCIDEPFGYVPTEKMLIEGGYEADAFCEAFGLCKIVSGIEELVKLQFEEMLDAADR